MGVQQTSVSRYGKRLAAVLGLTAAASMITLSIVSSNFGGQAASMLARSGSSSIGGVAGHESPPAVPDMQVGNTQTATTPAGRANTNMRVGATETPTTPADAPATEKATPVVRAHG